MSQLLLGIVKIVVRDCEISYSRLSKLSQGIIRKVIKMIGHQGGTMSVIVKLAIKDCQNCHKGWSKQSMIAYKATRNCVLSQKIYRVLFFKYVYF